MGDIWAFLLQTLTASGVAVLLMVVKTMFRDQLPPRWQFAVWGVLALVLLMPAGGMGRYVLFDWPLLIEWVKSALTGEYDLTRVIAPVPLPALFWPKTVFDWLFQLYFVGTVVMFLRYLLSYIRFRAVLRKGTPIHGAMQQRIEKVAEQYALPVCSMTAVEGISSAFVCGVIHPILVVPAGADVDEKVILHELLHLKHHDVLWGLVICLFRCIHWCNPLMAYCANQAENDLESLCDQRVLERLEGEARRDYGRILLSMANEKYARAPGTSSMANGGANIRRRIEAIARFKRYPAGMGLASVCVIISLTVPLLIGVRANAVYDRSHLEWSLASARVVRCTTAAGALDAYGKLLLTRNGIYRALCAPMSMQREIAEEMRRQEEAHTSTWDIGLSQTVSTEEGYYLYNLEIVGEDAYEGLMVVKLCDVVEHPLEEEPRMALAVQKVRAEREQNRWVVLPQEPLRRVEVPESSLQWGCSELPSYTYSGTAEDFRLEEHFQKNFVVDNTIQDSGAMQWLTEPTTHFDLTPKPDAQFDTVYWFNWSTCTYVGDEEKKDAITHIGVSMAQMEEGQARPELRNPGGGNSSGGSSSGESWESSSLFPGWKNEREFGGGGSSGEYDRHDSFTLPDCYAAELYLNEEKAAELTLYLLEGGAA